MSAAAVGSGLDAHHVACNPVQPGMDAVFDAARGHELHADANAEERLAAFDHLALQRLDHARHAVESGPAIGEGAHARQHDAIGAGNLARAGGDQHAVVRARFACSAFEGFRGGAEIAGAVVDDGDGHGWVVRARPSCWGPPPPGAGSISTATRKARARPLKQLSTMWWLLSP